MSAFILRRLLQAVFVMATVAFIAFMLFQFVGDPVLFMLGQDATPEQVRELRELLGLDRSFIVQFGNFLLNAVQGDFGISLRQGAWKTVEQKALFAVRLLDAFLDQPNDDVIGDQITGIHDFLGFDTQWRLCLDGRPEHVARGYLGNSISFSEVTGLSAFTGSRSAQQDQPHDVMLLLACASSNQGSEIHAELHENYSLGAILVRCLSII